MSLKLAPKDRKAMTPEELGQLMPKRVRRLLNKDNLEKINDILLNSDIHEEYRENLTNYANVMQDGNYSMEQYIAAVKYVTCKMLGATNFRSWCMTFPERYKEYVAKGISQNDIESRVSAFNRSQLVNKIMEQTLIPVHVLNVDLHQKAINHLAHLMINAKSEKVQSDSAAKLVDALKMPETTKVELDIGIKEDKSIQELRQSTLELVAQQKLMLKSGAMTPKEIAHSKLAVIDGDAEVIENAK